MKKWERIRVGHAINGHARAVIEVRGRLYVGTITDMPTLDSYRSDKRGWKKAAEKLYNDVLRQTWGYK